MAETNTDNWARLREPFPAERVLKLPATNRRPELDYVSHADVTDRLLQVDPTWSWEWGVNDPQTGLPSKALSLIREDRTVRDRNGQDSIVTEWSLWMALTVNGVTRRDVGYAPADKDEALKHVVSDALRRAAMRHGVALDLWEKDDTGPGASGGSVPPAQDPRQRAPASSGAPGCPTPGCAGHLVQRATKTGKNPGSPFLVCDTGKDGCGLPPMWDTALEDYQGHLADREAAGDLDAPPPPTPANGQDLVQQIAGLCKGVVPSDVRDAFGSVEGGSACLAAMADGTWKIRGAALKALSEEAKQQIADSLSSAQIPF